MQTGASPIFSMIPIAAIFLIFYFLVIRPQQKQAKEHQKMLEDLRKGDRVLTGGGLYGTIVGFRGADLEVKIADNVKVLLARSAVSRRLSDIQAGTPAANSVAAAS